MKGFEAHASNAVLDFTGDDDSLMRKKKNLMRWDVKKKKYVRAEQASPNCFNFIWIIGELGITGQARPDFLAGTQISLFAISSFISG